MKVLIIASWYPNADNRINGVFVKEQARALLSAGVCPIVLFPYDRSIPKGKMIRYEEDGIITYRANTDYIKNTKLSRMNSILKGLRFVDEILRDYDIDIIHAHVCYSAGFVAAFYKLRHKVPVVITEHASYVWKYNKKFYNRLLFKFAYESADLVIPVSSALESELGNLGFNFKSSVIGNVVDTKDTAAVKREAEGGIYNVLFIGLMDPKEIKGLQYLIPAISNFLGNHKDIDLRFHIVGDGEKRGEYEKMCCDAGIESSCIFYGKLDKHEIPELVKECDFLVSSSLKETFGSTLIEAMAWGKPVLATKCGGPEDFVNDRVGILVEPGSSDALEMGIEYMIKHYDEFDPDYIRKYAEENFSFESIGNKLKNIYEDILRK